MRIHLLASGSSGNATIVEGPQGALLIDCGVNKKAFFERCAATGFDPRTLAAVLITHEHSDHVGGLGVCMRGLARTGLDLPIYATEPTLRAAAVFAQKCVATQLEAVPLGTTLTLAGMRVTGFATSHDAAQPQGFRIEYDGQALGYLTDTGCLTAEASELLQGCDLLALESNHDPTMLRTGPYPFYLKQRIASKQGHLSNTQANEALGSLLNNRLEAVVALHLSQENNTPQLARDALAATLAKHSHPAQVFAASQHQPLTVTVK
jgi:phosphoribosyl 1,2-cyclic phosphodiesterase